MKLEKYQLITYSTMLAASLITINNLILSIIYADAKLFMFGSLLFYMIVIMILGFYCSYSEARHE